MKASLFLLGLIVISQATTFTEFTQCDPVWGDEILGSGPSTICDIGCLVSSVAMFLNTYGVQVDGELANPGLLNQWLDENNGYNGENFLWASQGAFGFNYLGEFAPSEVTTNFDEGHIVILHVRNGHHYVLMNSYDGDTYYVNDPYYPVDHYMLSDVVACNIYAVPSSVQIRLSNFRTQIKA